MRAAVIQINSGQDRSRNIRVAGELVAAAAADGAELVVLPEKWSMFGSGEILADGAETRSGKAVFAAREWARGNRIHLLAGSFTEVSPTGLPTNTSVLINPRGEIVAEYRKLHLFDVEAGGVEYRESDHEQAGNEIVVATAGELRIGLTICYDIRFPELYRALLDLGANCYSVPAAFTAATGKDHWEPLLRARAIENLSHVVAPAQSGFHENGRETHGDSMIVDCWGRVLARLPRGTGVVVGEIDLVRQREVRQNFPSVDHRRLTP